MSVSSSSFHWSKLWTALDPSMHADNYKNLSIPLVLNLLTTLILFTQKSLSLALSGSLILAIVKFPKCDVVPVFKTLHWLMIKLSINI